MSQQLDLLLQPSIHHYHPAISRKKEMLDLTPNELIDWTHRNASAYGSGYYNSMLVLAVVCTPLSAETPQALLLRAPGQTASWTVPFAWLPEHDGLPSLASVSTEPDADQLTVSAIAMMTAEKAMGCGSIRPVNIDVGLADASGSAQSLNTLLIVVVLESDVDDTQGGTLPHLKWMSEGDIEQIDKVQFRPNSGKARVIRVLKARKALVEQRSQQVLDQPSA
ncbi:hypothetical protein LTR85_005105 [Meristemomyces frigidus]|nr:hypothetical protein LTR85_005105 [Meristemomyces frigidus]